ncbi:MAG: hypothetical protein WD206_07430 [Actinomycetota bacterium]
MQTRRPHTRSARERFRAVHTLSVLALVALLASCTGSTEDVPSPSAAIGAAPPVGEPTPQEDCAHIDAATGTVTTFRTRSKACVDAGRLVAYRCGRRLDPVVVLRLAGAHPRSFIGGRFSVGVRELPEGARRIGATDAAVVWTIDDGSGGQTVYVDEAGTIRRWLEMPAAGRVSDPPEAFLLGDSILDGARYELEADLAGWVTTIDAEIGRGSAAGIVSAQEHMTSQAATGGTGPTVAVIELGTNDADPALLAESAATMLESFARTPVVVWVTVRSPMEPAVEVNRQIRRAVAAAPNATLADWNRAVPDDALQPDGVHLLPQRTHEFADFLTPYLEAWHAAARGEGARSCGSEVAAALAER